MIQSERFVVVGYAQSTVARGGIGSLLLAARDGDSLVSVCSVGTGFNEKHAVYFNTTLEQGEDKEPAVQRKGKNLVFAQPTPIADMKFRGWTDDGNLRHASYKGLREIQDHADIFEVPVLA